MPLKRDISKTMREFHRTQRRLTSLVESGEITTGNSTDAIESLEDLIEHMHGLTESLCEEVSDQGEKEELWQELEQVEKESRETIRLTNKAIREKINPQPANAPSSIDASTSGTQANKGVRRTQMDWTTHGLRSPQLPVFSGEDYENWKITFDAFVGDEDIPEKFKMIQLKACLGGDPLKLVSRYNPTAAGYTKARSELERKYGGTGRRIRRQLEEIRAMKPVRAGNCSWKPPEETIQGPPGDPVAVKTPLGWTAFGPVSGAEMESIKTLRTHIRSKLKVENQEEIKAMREMTELEVIGVREQKEKILSVEDKEAMKKVEKMKHEGGRYEVNVPWRNDEPNLSGNFGYALSRLRKTEENMKKRKDEAMEKKYGEIFEDYVKKGYFLKIAAGDENWTAATCEGWFLPHFPVIRQDRATTKIRLVFDAAAKYQGRSLNDELYPGPSICSDLIEILLGFRRHSIALTGDVEEMFLQVKLATADKKYHRVLWRDGEAERAPDIYEAQRWIFGNAAAPFAAQYVMKENAQIHAAEFPLAAQAVERSFYMDDALCSFKTEEEAKEAREQLTDVMKQAGMHIRKWRSSSSDVTASIPEKERAKEPEFKIEDGPNQTSKTLGLLWNADEDTLGICATTSSDAAPENRPTKRLCLKKIAAVFDPLCLICPLTITAKIIFQEPWARGLDWDDPLPPDMEAEWLTWLEDI